MGGSEFQFPFSKHLAEVFPTSLYPLKHPKATNLSLSLTVTKPFFIERFVGHWAKKYTISA